MPYAWRRPLAVCLALVLSSACRSGSDITPPDGGTNPPPEQPHPPPEQPPPPPERPPPPPPPGQGLNPGPLGAGARILFIGNSLTDANGLPELVRSLSNAAGLHWTVEAEVMGGAALEDHWNAGAAVPRIQGGDWDVVVLQQGPSALPESRVNLRQWTPQFDNVIRQAGGRSALYMVWPMTERFSDYDRVRDSYALAARDVSGYFLPAGESWRAAWREDPATVLYGPDGFDPTLAGSYAAALTIFTGLSGLPPEGLPAPAGVDAPTAASSSGRPGPRSTRTRAISRPTRPEPRCREHRDSLLAGGHQDGQIAGTIRSRHGRHSRRRRRTPARRQTFVQLPMTRRRGQCGVASSSCISRHGRAGLAGSPSGRCPS
jgi:hypothetical protein